MNSMEEKKERRAVAKKLITPMMKEWQPISPKIPVYNREAEADKTEEIVENAEAEKIETAIDDNTEMSENSEVEIVDIEEADDELIDDEASEELPQTDLVFEDLDIEFEEPIAEESITEDSVIEEPVIKEPRSSVALSDNKSGKGMGWYVVHTYSGYENKVKANIEKAIENRHLENEILEVRVPLQDVMEVKNGVEKSSQKKLFPGYVLLHMDADNNDAWYVVRNTRGVTGFVGPGSKPVPLTDEELRALDFSNDIEIEFAVGDLINVVAGVWKDTVGTVQEVDAVNRTVKITIEMFGRETPVEISFTDVKKLI